jgi:hypothetical protein
LRLRHVGPVGIPSVTVAHPVGVRDPVIVFRAIGVS